MDEPNLPRDLLERTERRWAAMLSHLAARRPDKRVQTEPSPDGARQPPEDKPALSTPKRPDWNGLF
jgi:hypothetical protein